MYVHRKKGDYRIEGVRPERTTSGRITASSPDCAVDLSSNFSTVKQEYKRSARKDQENLMRTGTKVFIVRAGILSHVHQLRTNHAY